jgi:ATP-dependent DNA ligase
MRLRLAKEPFDHPDYIFELKHDGFRAIAYLEDGDCKLISRRQNTLAFRSLKNNLANLSVGSAIIDGEVVCLDFSWKEHFQPTFEAQSTANPTRVRSALAQW